MKKYKYKSYDYSFLIKNKNINHSTGITFLNEYNFRTITGPSPVKLLKTRKDFIKAFNNN